MSKVSLRRAVIFALTSLGFALGPSGCKRSQPSESQPSPAPSASFSALPQLEEPSRCRQLPGFSMTLSPEAVDEPAEPQATEAGDDDALLPFGVELGTAVATPWGFAAAGIRGAGQAFVALVTEHDRRRVDLGVLHGDAETPALAAAGDDLLVALRSTDAAGFTIKLARVGREGGPTWGYELSKLGKSVTGLDVAVNGKLSLLAFQSEEKGTSKLWLGSLSLDALKEPFEVKALDVKDAEMPRVLARPGGFWLAWVRMLSEAKTPGKTAPSGSSAEDPEERELLEVGLRVIEVVKLDERGRAQGAPLRVGTPRPQVLLFDVAVLAAGGLLVAARSDSAAPGAEGGAILLSEVGPDGSVHEDRIEDDDVGVGAPVLLVDANSKLPGPWLSVGAPNDGTRLGLVRGQSTTLLADPLLGNAEVLAVSGGSFLTQRGRGRAAELRALSCAWPSDSPGGKK
jgi:hypothetical protein